MLPLFLANQITTNHDIAYRNRTLARRTHDRGRAPTHSRSTARQYSRSRAHQAVSQLQQHSAKGFREPLQEPARSGASRSLLRKGFISLYQNATDVRTAVSRAGEKSSGFDESLIGSPCCSLRSA